MNTLDVMFTMDCEAIADLAAEGGPKTWEFCGKAIAGYCETLFARNLKPTLFVVPYTAEKIAPLLLEMEKEGAELGLHYHPQDYGYADYLGAYDYDEQHKMLSEARRMWEDALGKAPVSFRGGNFSANDHTFSVLRDLGFSQGSLSVPGRNFTRVKSNWAGSPMLPYHTNRANRLLEGNMDFLEIPTTADWESTMWGGLTKLELRVEMVDARAHGFTVRKSVDRQLEQRIEHPYLLALTHNIFDYSDLHEFRRQVLDGLIAEIDSYAEKKELIRKGYTLSDYHQEVDTRRRCET